MKTVLILIGLIIFNGFLYSEWSDTRRSALTSGETVLLRYESGIETDHIVKHYTNQEWTQVDADNNSETTYEAAIPFSNETPKPLSFHIERGNRIDLIPGFTTQQPNSLGQMTLIKTYERNNDVANHLNIAAERVLFSDDSVYFALTNFGGGFPVSANFFTRFFTYTVNMFDPSQDNPHYVYSLVHTVNLQDLIAPGLYKVNAETEELTRIGNITTSIDAAANTLYLSCRLEDLTADEDFADFFIPDRIVTGGSMTQRIDNFGQNISIVDHGQIHTVHFQKQLLYPQENTLPTLSNVTFSLLNDTTFVSVDYLDLEGNFPIISEIVLDSDSTYRFVSAGNDFRDVVRFNTHFTDEWTAAVIRFSDNNEDFVEYIIDTTQPKNPRNISITIAGDSIHLLWDRVTENIAGNPVEVHHYRVYYSTVSPEDEFFQALANVTETNYLHQSAIENYDKIFYRITAVIERD